MSHISVRLLLGGNSRPRAHSNGKWSNWGKSLFTENAQMNQRDRKRTRQGRTDNNDQITEWEVLRCV